MADCDKHKHQCLDIRDIAKAKTRTFKPGSTFSPFRRKILASFHILLYALEVCNLNKSTMQSMDFTLNRFFMKLFRTSNMEIVTYCQEFFLDVIYLV